MIAVPSPDAAAAGALALFVHQCLEALVVDAETALGDELAGQVVGESIGVVELEGILGGDPRRACVSGLAEQPIEELAAAIERVAEALLLVVDPAHDRLALGAQCRVGGGQQLDRTLGEAPQVGRLEAEHPALVDRPAHDPAQHVAAALVRGDDAVGDQLDRAADVIGDDPHRPGRGRVVTAVGTTGELRAEIDERVAADRCRRRTRRPAGSPPSARGRGRCRCSWPAARSASRPHAGRMR